ncbi:DUF2249 domain-containing protein [Cellulomonas cellasea]|uniref:Uncharacterized protein (DUF2249 family) n=1 Tax=Cellulomonas cellasea TaxID=43670 RepID=A0A7W4UKZ0_9CELL|nr:DUF2249 domain-containing protein [Cellulomonas cellasea]MBB2925473.1 uncharacterized protein (DUF2249 family) [Cellulomonas cellasea]
MTGPTPRPQPARPPTDLATAPVVAHVHDHRRNTVTQLPLASAGTTPSSGGCGCGGHGGCGGGAGAQGSAATAEPTTATVPDAQPGDLDVRPLAPAQRHERIFAAVAALLPGESFVLTNDHDPKPLRYQLDAEEPGQIAWEYLAEGPDVWRVRLTRAAGHCC